ncbi:MAG: pyridoxamine 5'-phosphate oxidase [Actinobacteria bacterium]|nr:pyridoxamine 5'-phosphate oxidase [Actinomycetota bacterium]
MDLTELRLENERKGLDVADVARDPLTEFSRWYEQARASGLHQPEAMSLATVDANSRPSVRHVLLKRIDSRGFAFFTNYDSAKARHLARNPHASLVFPWHQLSRQVRASGIVEKVSADESDAYFATRPRGSQLSAWASEQSSVISGRWVLEDRLRALEERFAGAEVGRPPFWGGYLAIPYEIEFWQGRSNRLHDRVRYRRHPEQGWIIERLAP